jgi:hypothetical protein
MGYSDADTQFLRGIIIPLEGMFLDPIIFQWNPAAIENVTATPWIELPSAGRSQPFLQYTCGKPRVYKFHIQVSRSNNSDWFPKNYIGRIKLLQEPTVMGEGVNHPPICKVILGSFLNVTCFIKQTHVKYGEIFHPDYLTPRDAQVEITVEEFR